MRLYNGSAPNNRQSVLYFFVSLMSCKKVIIHGWFFGDWVVNLLFLIWLPKKIILGYLGW